MSAPITEHGQHQVGRFPLPMTSSNAPEPPPSWRERDVVFISMGDGKVTAEQAAHAREMILSRMPEVADVIFVPGVSVTVHRTGGPA